MSEIVKLYNPANAAGLNSSQVEGLQKLSSAEIKELALAYPNMTMQRAYLLIIDNRKPAEKQLPSLSSFENLWNLREKNGLRHFVAYAFKSNYKPPVKNGVPVKSRKSEVVDLSETDLLSLPGFKTPSGEEPAQEVKVTKIKREKISEPVTPKTKKQKV